MSTLAEILTDLDTLATDLTGKILSPGQVAVAQADLDTADAAIQKLLAVVSPPVTTPVTPTGTVGGSPVVVPTLPSA